MAACTLQGNEFDGAQILARSIIIEIMYSIVQEQPTPKLTIFYFSRWRFQSS